MKLSACFVALSLLSLSLSASAQSEERKNAIIRAVGEQPAETLFTVYDAVNALAEGWVGGVFEADRAAELADSYHESAELALRLVKTAPSSDAAKQVIAASESLVTQAAALEAWVKLGEDSLVATYQKHKASTDSLLLGGSVPPKPPSGEFPASPTSTDADSEEAVLEIAEAVGEDLGHAERWKPDADILAQIAATPEDAAILSAYSESIYKEIPSGKPAAKSGQTEIRIEGPEWDDLPGGYSKYRSHFQEGVQFYGFKYVEPGKSLGMSYDGAFKVDGKWYFVPKTWRAFSSIQQSE